MQKIHAREVESMIRHTVKGSNQLVNTYPVAPNLGLLPPVRCSPLLFCIEHNFTASLQ